MLAVHVDIQVKPGCAERFIEATKENAKNSIRESGIARFDLIQDQSDPRRFLLVEVYRNEEAPALHKKTFHYNFWRNAVEEMMEKPRVSKKYTTLFPEDESGWDCL